MARRQEKNGWALFLLILVGITIGGLIGELAAEVPFLTWLNLGYSFGIGTQEPLQVNLRVIQFVIGLEFEITLASIIGVAIAIFTYRKI